MEKFSQIKITAVTFKVIQISPLANKKDKKRIKLANLDLGLFRLGIFTA
jgi:hypothetical protein